MKLQDLVTIVDERDRWDLHYVTIGFQKTYTIDKLYERESVVDPMHVICHQFLKEVKHLLYSEVMDQVEKLRYKCYQVGYYPEIQVELEKIFDVIRDQ